VLEQILKYVKRREVARELTARGIDKASGESLNRWVRDGKELPPKVERELLKIFGLPDAKTAAPDIPERLEAYLIALSRKAGVTEDELAQAEADVAAARVIGGAAARPRLGNGGGATGTV
jgi:hypothetical protein